MQIQNYAYVKNYISFQLKIPIKLPHDHISFVDFSMFECEYCAKVFTLKSTLYRHAFDNGLKIEKIHRGIEFKEKPWLKQYIDFNTEKRTHATTKFMKDCYKLMNNAVYGKTMENVRNHKKHKLVTGGDMERKYVRLPNVYNSIEITGEISVIQFKYSEVKLDKPIYVGLSILDISKTLIISIMNS